MTNELDSVPELPRVQDFFLARQPILNREQTLIAYELLFRRAREGEANIADDLSATASVIAHASELGMEQVIGASLGFFNVDAAVLLSDFIKFLPAQKVILEILETVDVTPAVVARVAELCQAGYKFALDDVVADSAGLRKLLPYITIVKIDIAQMVRADIAPLCQLLKKAGKILLAEKVETIEEFEYCMTVGFDFFQGYYFARPIVIAGKKLTPSQMTVVRIMALLDADADTPELERCIKHDAAIGITLLRLVNTPAVGAARRIDTLSQALYVLGRRQLHRWLQIMLYAEPHRARHSISPLLLMATTRGRLLELIAQKCFTGERAMADRAFAVGIMSLMDTLFGIPMENILMQMPVAEEVSTALLAREGVFGDMLNLVEYLERLQDSGAQAMPVLQRLQISNEDLLGMQLAAFEWSDSIALGA
ncbi:MAG TPA: EAL domain-containing protein [Burkholderiaceae bacterium]|jgi:EAL and modified HD-GYP domain-containing signal transduction protein